MVDGPVRCHYITSMDAAAIAAKEVDMKATYGFRATMRARPGKGDELVALLLTAATDAGPATNENCLLYLVGRSASDPDVVHVTEGWTTKEAHTANFAGEATEALVAKLAPLVTEQGAYQDEVPVGGKFNPGAMR
jgi:quinol monooxygenase YgiN